MAPNSAPNLNKNRPRLSQDKIIENNPTLTKTMKPHRIQPLSIVSACVLAAAAGLWNPLHAPAQPEKGKSQPSNRESLKKETPKRGQARSPAKPERARPEHPRPPIGAPVTFLGVAAVGIEPAVRAQLDLPAGTGLAVGDVVKNSPADKAGLEKYDILTKLDDQILVSGEQFQTLVRLKQPGDAVTLTLLRAAKEKTIKVKLGSHRFPAVQTPPRDFQFEPWRPRYGPPPPWDRETWRDDWKEWGEHWGEDMQEWGKGMQQWWKEYGKGLEKSLREYLEDHLGDAETWGPKMERWLERMEEQPRAYMRNFVKAHATIIDEDGKVEITYKDGKKHVTATDPDGDIIFEGFCETDAERKKVPEDVLKKVDSVKLDVRFNSPEELREDSPKPKKPSPAKRPGANKDTA